MFGKWLLLVVILLRKIHINLLIKRRDVMLKETCIFVSNKGDINIIEKVSTFGHLEYLFTFDFFYIK